MRRLACILITLVLLAPSTFSQSKKGGSISSFDLLEFNKLLLKGLNKFRVENGVDTLDAQEILQKASEKSSSAMAKAERADAKGLASTTPKNLKKSGGSGKGEEIIIVTPNGKGKNPATPEEVVKVILAKWAASKKERDVILKSSNTYVGISGETDEADKRIYISVVFGNFQSFNEGAKHKKELKVPFNTKSKKLKDADPRKCKNCEKFKDAEVLQAGLSVENGKVYLSYNNIKNLKRLLKKSTDGLAVDIIQKEQYSKEDYNIMDNAVRNKGVMLKVVKKDKLFSKNLIKPEDPKKKNKKVNKLKVEMGVFPKEIKGPFEMNLLIVQDGIVCKTVLRSYTEFVDQESNTPFEMLPMPESLEARKPPFEPRSESSLLSFTIPFEKNKFEFKKEDVQPFIDALQEPDFIIDGLYIYAYSSIEGDSNANTKLQRKRAESVVKVLQAMQQNKIAPNIMTNDSWNLFVLEMEDGKYDHLTKMTKQEAIKTINHTKGLTEELEPFLSKERFAQIVMDVTYDISGSKEEKFSVVQFNRAVKGGNIRQAYRIMDYIANKVLEKKYTEESFDKIQIPAESKFIGLQMNKIYYQYLLSGKVVNEEEYNGVMELLKADGSNTIIKYNSLFCKVLVDSTIGDKTAQAEMQLKIDDLYKTDLSKNIIDALNIEWQFKIMDALDTLEGADAERQACIDKIKSFYDFKNATWQNAVKLAYAFARAKDFKFAAGILEPYLDKPEEKVLYAYVSIASHVPEKFFSHKFANALSEIKALNKDKYCKLFGEPFMSFQVLDNPAIKKEYRTASCPE
ncbi:MAG TPA: CAP domain-containing protein [Bacteroidia bacterium]|jgi:hypothetical protein|nr:CAP domain-containing protein [Bacteroidia bacterium]